MSDQSDDPLASRSPEERIFLKFIYPEVKDLAKQFLTLILGSLVLSVTFSEKIVSFSAASIAQQICLLLSWLLLIVSLGMAGYGLYLIFLAAEQACGSIIYDYVNDFRDITRRSYLYLDWSAFIYGAGLVLLVVAGAMNFSRSSSDQGVGPPDPALQQNRPAVTAPQAAKVIPGEAGR
jgi:hypothetical protein